MLLPPPPDDHDHGHELSLASDTDTPNLRNNHKGESLGTIMDMDIELENGTTDPGLSTHADRGIEAIPDEKDQTVRENPWPCDS